MNTPLIAHNSYLASASVRNITGAAAGTTGDAVVLDELPFRIFEADPTSLPVEVSLSWSSLISVSALGFAYINAGTVGAQTMTVFGTNSISGSGVPATLYSGSVAHNGAVLVSFAQASINVLTVRFSPGTGLRLATIYPGEALQMPLPIYGGHAPLKLNQRAEMRGETRGQLLGRKIIRKQTESEYAFRHLGANFYRANLEPVIAYARTAPIMISWRPQQYPDEAQFLVVSDEAQPQNMGLRDLMSVSMPVRGYAIP
jgi:hypothetical protein